MSSRRRVARPAAAASAASAAEVAVALLLVVLLVACSARRSPVAAAEDGRAGDAPCPVAPIGVVVSVEQWGELVRAVGGACARVRVLVEGSSGDPHEFEPAPADLAAIERAGLVVTNGLGYDSWAGRAALGAPRAVVTVDAGEAAGRHDGDNPHLWFDPVAVHAVSGAVSAGLLARLGPGAAPYLAARAGEWSSRLAAVDDRFVRVSGVLAGRRVLATESVYDLALARLGVVDATPAGYARAAANESDPAPADLAAAERVIRNREVAAVVVNRQTAGAAPLQLQRAASAAGVPVVMVTETMPAAAHGSLVAWQLAQLDALAAAVSAP